MTKRRRNGKYTEKRMIQMEREEKKEYNLLFVEYKLHMKIANRCFQSQESKEKDGIKYIMKVNGRKQES